MIYQFSETLRLYPILPFLIRVCNERYQLNEHLFIEKGTRIIVPVLGLQTDPLYYNNPNEFNPENFSKEAKAKRHHYTYLPFGEGPRNCIGTNFVCIPENNKKTWKHNYMRENLLIIFVILLFQVCDSD